VPFTHVPSWFDPGVVSTKFKRPIWIAFEINKFERVDITSGENLSASLENNYFIVKREAFRCGFE
jgi:hypothetical protein